MSASGRLLLLFSLAWAAFWGIPACPEESGARLLEVIAAEPFQDLRERCEPHLAHREVFEAPPESFPSESLAPERSQSTVPSGSRSLLAGAATGPALSSDILLLIQRQNE